MAQAQIVHLLDKDRELIERARRRGGDRAANRLAKVIAAQRMREAELRDEKRAEQIADTEDRAWPPSFLAK